MATFQVRVQDLATIIATECKAIRTLANGNAADLSALTTTAKGNLVSAINELKAELESVASAGGATINDASDVSAVQTWSISKIVSELQDTSVALKAEILGGAGAAYDTLQELKTFIDDNADGIGGIMTALGHRVRTDTAAQGLSTLEKQNARTNIDAYGPVEIGNPDTNFVAVFTSGLV